MSERAENRAAAKADAKLRELEMREQEFAERASDLDSREQDLALMHRAEAGEDVPVEEHGVRSKRRTQQRVHRPGGYGETGER